MAKDEDALTEAIDAMGRATFRFHHFMADDLENSIVHRQVIGLLSSAMPNAYAALKELLSAVDRVKLEGHDWK